jgi:hypothetical protein
MKPEKGEDVRVLMLALIAGLAAPAWAQEIDSIQLLSQGEFRLLSEDLGGALSYRPQIATEPLGTTGFDVGLALTAARLKNTDILERATSDGAPTRGCRWASTSASCTPRFRGATSSITAASCATPSSREA